MCSIENESVLLSEVVLLFGEILVFRSMPVCIMKSVGFISNNSNHVNLLNAMCELHLES